MGIIIAVTGLFIAVPLVCFIILFTGNIIFTDTLIISIIGSVLLHVKAGLHPVFCLLAGAALFAGINFLYLHEKMFWAFTIASTASWGYLAGFLANDIIGDQVWSIFLGCAMAILVLTLHVDSRNRPRKF